MRGNYQPRGLPKSIRKGPKGGFVYDGTYAPPVPRDDAKPRAKKPRAGK
jgi:hypothetical protein